MKPIFIVANWKMQLTLHESIALAEGVEQGIRDCSGSIRVILCPSFTALPSVQQIVRQSTLGAQDMFWESRGAFTGEISARMLLELGCSAVILGHSERREYLGETDTMVQKKLSVALVSGLIPIVCVGETRTDRDTGRREEIVRSQVAHIFSGVDIGSVGDLFLAYEPRWAIGTGDAVVPEDAEHMHQVIRRALHDVYPEHSLDTRVRVLYGGSVDCRNAAALILQPSISGFLIGTASRRLEDFLGVVTAVAENHA